MATDTRSAALPAKIQAERCYISADIQLALIGSVERLKKLRQPLTLRVKKQRG
jgi:hypothetical protein